MIWAVLRLLGKGHQLIIFEDTLFEYCVIPLKSRWRQSACSTHLNKKLFLIFTHISCLKELVWAWGGHRNWDRWCCGRGWAHQTCSHEKRAVKLGRLLYSSIRFSIGGHWKRAWLGNFDDSSRIYPNNHTPSAGSWGCLLVLQLDNIFKFLNKLLIILRAPLKRRNRLLRIWIQLLGLILSSIFIPNMIKSLY